MFNLPPGSLLLRNDSLQHHPDIYEPLSLPTPPKLGFFLLAKILLEKDDEALIGLK